MEALVFPLAVTIERTELANRWASEKWEAVCVEPDAATPAQAFSEGVRAAGPATGELVLDGPRIRRWRWRGLALDLHRSEGEGYYLNLSAPEPRVFVMWRLEEGVAQPVVTTISYNEAGRMMDGGEQVDGVPMPPEVRAWAQPWVEANYKPEPRRKQKRNERFWRTGS